MRTSFRIILYCFILIEVILHARSRNVKRSMVREYDKIWSSGNVIYDFSSVFHASERGIIQEAMSELENATTFRNRKCISFHEKTGSYVFDTDYIYFQKGTCERPEVGQPDGRRIIHVNTECLNKATLMYYLLRVLGMYDEHTRSDRDQYIDVHMDNVVDGDRSKFTKLSPNAGDSYGLPYDFKSLTHFGPYEYAKDPSKPTITSKIQGVGFGQKSRLSVLDVERVERLYRCKLDTSNVVDVASLPVYCNFEEILCNLGDDWRDNYKWKREKGPLPDSGPTGDHSNGNGYFVYVNGSTNKDGGFARLISAWEMQSGMYCIQLAYYIQGNNTLNVYAENFENHDNSSVISTHQNMRPVWTEVKQRVQPKTLWRVIIQAVINDPTGGVAIDDVSVMYGDCP